MSNFWSAVYLVLYLFLVFLLARLTIAFIRYFSRSWHPRRGLAVVFEGIYSVTDPPLRALRRAIRPVQVGGVAIDVAYILLFIVVQILLVVVPHPH